MRHAASCLLLLCLALGAGCGVGTSDLPSEWSTPAGTEMSPDERALALQVLDLVNEARAQEDQPALLWDERAADAAYDHCVDMRLRGFYAHVNPDGEGPCERLLAQGIAMTSCGGENIARSNDSAADLVEAFLSSEEHRATMLSSAHTHVGIGVHTGPGGPWWVQDFFVAAGR